MVETDLELAQLLCTRLCHDMAGPVGAVAAGVELIGDDPAQADEETLALIGDSSAAAARKLRFLRAALGIANGPAEDLRGLLDGYLDATAGAGGKAAVGWPAADELSAARDALGAGVNQVLLNLCLLGLEMQPGCRTLSLAVHAGGSLLTIVIDVAGSAERAHTWREDMQSAVLGTGEHPVTVKTVQGYITGQLVRALGGTFELADAPQGVKLTATFAAPLS